MTWCERCKDSILYCRCRDKCKPSVAHTASQQEKVSSTDGLAAAVRYEIDLAERQIQLLLLRIEQNPAIAANVRPFGSNLHRMVKRLKKALAAANVVLSDEPNNH